MKYVAAVLMCLTLAACQTPPTFFGATRTGDYRKHFEGAMTCAWIKGWAPDPEKSVCMCAINDPYFSDNKSFIVPPPPPERSEYFCGKQ